MLTLYRLSHPKDATMPWLHHSLVSLSADRPDLYRIKTLEPGTRFRGEGAVYICLSFGRIDNAKWALSDPTVRAWVEAGATIIFDESGESGLYYPEQWRTLRRTIEELGLKHCRMLWLLQNEHGPRLCREAFAGHPTLSAEAVVIHYWMHRLRIDATGGSNEPAERVKRFACLNHKMHAHRRIVLDWIEANGFTDKGYISYTREDGTRVTVDEDVRSQIVPWKILAGAGFNLVNETEMTGGEILRFTEKTLKPLAAGRPFIVNGNPGVLKLLRRMGFKTLSPLIDETYDEIADPHERLTRALAEAGWLISLSEPDFDRMLGWMQPILDHNANHFFNGLPAIMEAQHAALLNAVKRPIFA
jgi:hypothetical protein